MFSSLLQALRVHTEAYVLDKDGTLVGQGAALPGASEFVRSLNASRVPYVILSNTGEQSPDEVATGLSDILGEAVRKEQVHTAREETLGALRAAEGRFDVVRVVGRPAGTLPAFDPSEDPTVASDASLVLLLSDGHVPDFCETVALVAAWVHRGAHLWASSADASLAVAQTDRRRPGPGVFLSAVEATLGRPLARLRIFGKGGSESRTLGDTTMALLRGQGFRGTRRAVLMVGDRFDTDVRAGWHCGWSTCLVETGCHTAADHANLYPADVADSVAQSVRDLLANREEDSATLSELLRDVVREALRRSPQRDALALWIVGHVERAAARLLSAAAPRRIRSYPDVTRA